MTERLLDIPDSFDEDVGGVPFLLRVEEGKKNALLEYIRWVRPSAAEYLESLDLATGIKAKIFGYEDDTIPRFRVAFNFQVDKANEKMADFDRTFHHNFTSVVMTKTADMKEKIKLRYVLEE